MTYPDKQTFLALLRERRHEEVIEEYLLSGLPFAFRNDGQTHEVLLSVISKELATASESINVIGSGKIGFSLAPEKFGNPFSDNSDLDIAIVNDDLFDEAWMDILRRRRPWFSLDSKTREWLQTHQRTYIYFGFVKPDSLPGVVRISAKWFSTFNGLSRIRALASRRISGRLYRTRDHLVVHQKYTCKSILNQVLSRTRKEKHVDIHL